MKMALKQKLIVAIAIAFSLFLSTAGFAEKVVVIPLPYSSSSGDFAIYDATGTFIGYRLDGDNFYSLKVVNSKKFITQFSNYEYDPYTLDSQKAYLGVNDNSIAVYYASSDCSGDKYIKL